jgi:DNA-binding PadR family transcriptional regulator
VVPGLGSRANLEAMERRQTLSLNEWAVLGVLVHRPRHGYDIAAELQRGAEIGDVWRVTRPLVYRALERLEALGLVEARRTEPGEAAPPRTVYGPTRRGRATLRSWLHEPVSHVRDVRGALLLKLVILERLDLPHRELVAAQRAAFAPLVEGIATGRGAASVAALWRQHSAAAALAFLDALADPGGDPATAAERARRRPPRR